MIAVPLPPSDHGHEDHVCCCHCTIHNSFVSFIPNFDSTIFVTGILKLVLRIRRRISALKKDNKSHTSSKTLKVLSDTIHSILTLLYTVMGASWITRQYHLLQGDLELQDEVGSEERRPHFPYTLTLAQYLQMMKRQDPDFSSDEEDAKCKILSDEYFLHIVSVLERGRYLRSLRDKEKKKAEKK